MEKLGKMQATGTEMHDAEIEAVLDRLRGVVEAGASRVGVHAAGGAPVDIAGLLDRLVAAELPERRGVEAWASLLQAHATLMRRLESDLERETGLALADFDVLAQLARAGGEMRMTELAARALISRSGMTRRVTRLVEEGLVRRADADADGRGVVVALTDAGVARLAETAPVHARGISKLFVAQLDDQELAILERALGKVIIDCSFG
jgi:DNA-binding MarR family transcriptional regulator